MGWRRRIWVIVKCAKNTRVTQKNEKTWVKIKIHQEEFLHLKKEGGCEQHKEGKNEATTNRLRTLQQKITKVRDSHMHSRSGPKDDDRRNNHSWIDYS